MKYKLQRIYDTFRYDIPRFLKNIWLFRKCLWNHYSFDYTGMLRFMETCSNDMANCHEKYGNLVRSKQTAKELRIFAEYMKRIREDNYSTRYTKLEICEKGEGTFGMGWRTVPIKYEGPFIRTRNYKKICTSCEINDLEEATKLFKRKIKTWWD